MIEKYKWPFPNTPFPWWWKLPSYAAVSTVGILSRIWLTWANSTKVYQKHYLDDAVLKRDKGKALVTVANHYSCIDDPILCGMLPWSTFFTPHKLRWVPAAHDICFTKAWHGNFFGLGRCVPIVRGDGVYQRGMDFILENLNRGGWAQVFPEGKVNMEKSWIRLKWGVGRLISECKHVPIVVPFYHLGVDDILPPSSKWYIPRVGQKVTILIGEPMDFTAQLENCNKLGHTAMEKRKIITDVIQETLQCLKAEATKLHNARKR